MAQQVYTSFIDRLSFDAGTGYFADIFFLSVKQDPLEPYFQTNPKVDQIHHGWGSAMGVGYRLGKKSHNTLHAYFTKAIVKDAYDEFSPAFFTGIMFDTYSLYELVFEHDFISKRSIWTLGLGAAIESFKNQSPLYALYKDSSNRTYTLLYGFQNFRDVEPETVINVSYAYRLKSDFSIGIRLKTYFFDFIYPESLMVSPFIAYRFR